MRVPDRRAVRAAAIVSSAQLGGTERVLLDFAGRAFEYDVVVRVLTPRDGPLIGILNEIGVPAEVVPGSERLLRGSQRVSGLWSAPGAMFGLLDWSKRLVAHPFIQQADVVYTVSFKAHIAMALRRRHPVVWHLHEYPPELTAPVWRVLSRGADAMIANSEATAAAWAKRERGVKQGETETAPPSASRFPITVVRNGIELDRFRPRDRTFWIHDRLGIPHEHRLIGMPAVFARWKGQLEVIQAFRAIQQEFPAVHVVFVGGSIYDTVAEREYGDELQAAVAEARNQGNAPADAPGRPIGNEGDAPAETPHGTTGRIHIFPFQSKIEMAYPEFDLVLHYSLRPEAFGRVILEAMACGVPVIAANEGGPIEILGQGDAFAAPTGWLAPPRDPAALATLLRDVLREPPDRLRAIGAAARRRAEDRFSARQFAKGVAEVLRRAALGLP